MLTIITIVLKVLLSIKTTAKTDIVVLLHMNKVDE